jgi:putative tryptophan/tyrosine transport system substrate-binding protein
VKGQSRRRFLRGGLALAGLGLLAGCGRVLPEARPSGKVPRVGHLFRGGPTAAPVGRNALEEGLRDLGYAVGQQILIESRGTEHPEQYPDLVAELLRLPVDLLISHDSLALRAAKDATGTVPIVMQGAGDPVGSGLIASLARPGGNITGTTDSSPGLYGKQLELLKAVAPGVSRVAVLLDRSHPGGGDSGRERESAAQALALQLLYVDVRAPQDFEPAFETVVRDGADAIFPARQPLTSGNRGRIVAFAARSRLPATYPIREYVDEGGLMAYGVNLTDLHRHAATYVDKILKGASPADLPVERPTTFDFVINLRTAQALGLAIPPSVLQQATEVIQ